MRLSGIVCKVGRRRKEKERVRNVFDNKTSRGRGVSR